jgi:hypothetical protein
MMSTTAFGEPYNLNFALAIYRSWLAGAVAYDSSVEKAKKTIQDEAVLRGLSFEKLLQHNTGSK